MASVPTPVLRVLSGGAAQGLCEALAPAFEATNACRIEGRYGAVGGMRERLLAGEPCDVVILTRALVDTLAGQGRVVAASAVSLGVVATGVAVAEGASFGSDSTQGKGVVGPDTRSADGLRASLLTTQILHCPDTEKSTAGQHVMSMLRDMGIADVLLPRIQRYPGGNIAMAELARLGRTGQADGHLGITQVTEIGYTQGVRLVGLLPAPYALDTTYVAALANTAAQPELARSWLAELVSNRHAAARAQCGFA